ncbi:MAG: rhodanese-like domain-containing protein [Cyclobacteriaceae bacterium]|nr:rhodanese-like domain-containing protein [Cyclobacteriaceae bacterium]
MGILDLLLGKKLDYADLKAQGAVIVDVRSRGEFMGGHVVDSKNIPLDEISKRAEEIKKWNKPVVLCCASGNRSGSAKHILESKGVDAHNGGSWTNVQYNWNQ